MWCVSMKNLFLIFLFAIFSFVSLVFCQNTSILLIQPTDNMTINTQEIQFNFVYLDQPSNSTSNQSNEIMCVLNVDSTPIASILSEKNVQTSFSSNSLTSGDHLWFVNCSGVVSDIAYFQKRPLNNSYVELVFPYENYTSSNDSLEFSFIYHAANDDNLSENCYLNIANKQLGPLEIPSESVGVIEITSLPKKSYLWSVSCGEFESSVRTLVIEEYSLPSIVTVSPKTGRIFNVSQPEFEFIYNSGSEGPKQANCDLVIVSNPSGSNMLATISASTIATDKEVTKIKSNPLSNGSSFWYIQCNEKTSPYYAVTNEAQEIFIRLGENISEYENIEQTQNDSTQPSNLTIIENNISTSQPQVPIFASLIVPSKAFMGEQITIRVLDENSTPIKDASIVVSSSYGQSKIVFSDKDGYAKFVADYPASLNYSVSGYILEKKVFTNVVEKISTPNSDSNQNPNQPDVDSSKTGDSSIIFVLLAFCAVLVVALYFLFIKKPKEISIHSDVKNQSAPKSIETKDVSPPQVGFVSGSDSTKH